MNGLPPPLCFSEINVVAPIRKLLSALSGNKKHFLRLSRRPGIFGPAVEAHGPLQESFSKPVLNQTINKNSSVCELFDFHYRLLMLCPRLMVLDNLAHA